MAEECSHECSSCGVSGCGDRTEASGSSSLEPNKRSNIKNVIGVVSGKGGVGKSLVTSLLASEMQKRGFKVAILDADITGPSIPKSFGVDTRLTADADGINPAVTASGIEIMSVNLMLRREDEFVAWRGPVVSNAIKQFWQEVNWGDIDYMFVDMPPGTSDVFLTVFQSLPVDGIVTVSAPQELVAMIVGKAVNLARSMEVPVIGLVENMAYFKCDDCGKKHFIYGEPQGEEVAKRYEIPSVATLPLDPSFARLVDKGSVEDRSKYYDKMPVYTGGNVFFNGAKPCAKEENYRVDTEHKVYVKLVEKDGTYSLETNLYEFLPEFETGVVSTESLGEAFQPEQKFENPDGTEIIFNEDYYGSHRGIRPQPGPFVKGCSSQEVADSDFL